MSVNVISTPQQSTFWQRLTGTEPKTVVRETSTTTISSDPGGSFSLRTALRNGGIGAAVAGALGGVSLLGKVALPLIGKIGSVAGLVKLAGFGGAIGVATAALPLVAPAVNRSPAAKAALTGAGIGAAAGAVLPLLPIPIGAAIGAGVGLLIHNRRHHPRPEHQQYPGYQAYPGYVPYGTGHGQRGPHGSVPVTPNYGMYAGTAMNPYGNMSGYGLPQMGYGMPPMGYGMPAAQGYGMPMGYGALPMQARGPVPAGIVAQPSAQPVVQPAVQPAIATAPSAAPVQPVAARPAKFRGAKTFTDKAGNVRQVGTGTIVRPATGAVGVVPAGTPAPAGAYQPALGADTLGISSPLPQLATQPSYAGVSAASAGYGAMPAMPRA